MCAKPTQHSGLFSLLFVVCDLLQEKSKFVVINVTEIKIDYLNVKRFSGHVGLLR